MPRSTKAVRRKGSKFRHNLKNRSTAVKRHDSKKKVSKSTEKSIKNAWDKTRTVRENLDTMGLAFDPNAIVPIKQTRRDYIDVVDVEEVEKLRNQSAPSTESKRYKKKKNAKAEAVVQELEAAAEEQKQKYDEQDRKYRLPDRDAELCIYLIQRYDDDYQAMSRDAKNLFQYTPKQLAKKIKVFKDSAYFKALQ